MLQCEGSQNTLCTSWALKTHLQNFTSQLTFIRRNGKSDLVCYAGLSISDLMSKTQELDVDTTLYDIDNTSTVMTTNIESDESVIYQAVGILRKRMASKCQNTPNSEYWSPEEISQQKLQEFCDPAPHMF